MTHTRRVQVLSGILLVAFGLFAGEVVLITEAPVARTVRVRTKRVITRKASSSVQLRRAAPPPVQRPSKRAIRGQAASVSSFVRPAVTLEKIRCGDGIVVDEQCDDKNTIEKDGCSSSCTIETGFYCNKSQPTGCWSVCGDGVVALNEQCDDGAKANFDGCSSTCKIDVGYTCTGTPSACKPIPYCGNGIVEEGEGCDDDNTTSGDGCSESCTVETSS